MTSNGTKRKLQFAEREVTFHSDGIGHAGVLFLPDDQRKARRPGIVVCHGYGGTMSFIVGDIGKRLAEFGYVSMIFDYRGFGKSAGTRWRLIPEEQVQDIIDALTFLSLQEEVDAKRVGLLGISLGAANVIHAAARDSRVKATVSLNGFADGEDWLCSLRANWQWVTFLENLGQDRNQRVVTGQSRMVDPDEIMVRDPESLAFNKMLLEKYPDRPFKLPLETAERMIQFKPIHCIAKISPRAVLLIRTEKDVLMSEKHAHQLYEAALEPKRLIIIPGIQHHEIYYGKPFDQFMNIVVQWLEETL